MLLDGDLDTNLVCSEPLYHLLHSTQFQASSVCSYRSDWDACWANECRYVLQAFYGCLSRKDCPLSFKRTVALVRHPLRTVETLVVKYCSSRTSLPHPMLQKVLKAFFPSSNISQQSCIDSMASYWVAYYFAILPRVDRVARVDVDPVCLVLGQCEGLQNPQLFPMKASGANKIHVGLEEIKDEDLRRDFVLLAKKVGYEELE